MIGQFNTTNAAYILKGFEKYVKGRHWIDPYAGNGDLLEWADENGAAQIEGFDIDPKKATNFIQVEDTLLSPPS